MRLDRILQNRESRESMGLDSIPQNRESWGKHGTGQDWTVFHRTNKVGKVWAWTAFPRTEKVGTVWDWTEFHRRKLGKHGPGRYSKENESRESIGLDSIPQNRESGIGQYATGERSKTKYYWTVFHTTEKV